MEKKEEKKAYKVYPFRLNEKTILSLRKTKKKSGLSWNLFFYLIIKKYGDEIVQDMQNK